MVERTRLNVTFYLLCLSCCLVQRHEAPTRHRPKVTVTHPLKCAAKRRGTNKNKMSDVQLDCSKNVKIYMRGAATCFRFSQPSSGSYYMCFAKVIGINNQLTLRRLMSYIYIYIYIYIYMEHPFLMFLDHTQRRSTVDRTPLDE